MTDFPHSKSTKIIVDSFHQSKTWLVTFEILGANWEEVIDQFDRLSEDDIYDKYEMLPNERIRVVYSERR